MQVCSYRRSILPVNSCLFTLCAHQGPRPPHSSPTLLFNPTHDNSLYPTSHPISSHKHPTDMTTSCPFHSSRRKGPRWLLSRQPRDRPLLALSRRPLGNSTMPATHHRAAPQSPHRHAHRALPLHSLPPGLPGPSQYRQCPLLRARSRLRSRARGIQHGPDHLLRSLYHPGDPL